MQAIYRKYRPDTFDKVYGQKHITEILKHQIETGNISHAYIFSGSRGTGKTSCAKIFARAINCLDLQNGNPCNKCENCRSSIEESTLDIVEMDAASNRRIDDIRELRDKVIYPPTKLKYKVYIIDEAHMITNEGFNALLKIMEEPPQHLVFILATTEIDKIPQTILSRCQRYEFKMINSEDISENIKYILKDMNRKMDDDAIELIAKKADGAMRDALSILDQVLSIEKENITREDINNILGIVDNKGVFELVDGIIKKDTHQVLDTLYNVSNNKPVENVMEELLEHYRNLLLSKNNLSNLRTENIQYSDQYDFQSQSVSNRQIIESMNIIMEYQKKLKSSDNQKALLEIMTMRLIDYIDYDDLIARVYTLEEKLKSIEENGVKLTTSDTQKTDTRSKNEHDISKKNEKIISKDEKIISKNDIISSNESINKLQEDFYKAIIGYGFMTDEIASSITPEIENGNFILNCDGRQVYFAISPFRKIMESGLKDIYDFKNLEIREIEKNQNPNKTQKLKQIFGDNVEIIKK